MNIAQIVQYLKQDQVVAYPTEAVFGLGCNPFSEKAVTQLLSLKQRPVEKGLILVAPDLTLLRPFIAEERLQTQDWQRLQAHYARPITWVVPAKNDTPEFLIGRFQSIALRLCPHPAVKLLCQQTGQALTSTSANLSGLEPCRTASEVRQQFGQDFPVLDMPVGNADKPSEIRDLLTNQLFRQG